LSRVFVVTTYLSRNKTSDMATRSKRVSEDMEAGAEVKSEAGSELEELNEEEYERERLENIKYVDILNHPISNVPQTVLRTQWGPP